MIANIEFKYNIIYKNTFSIKTIFYNYYSLKIIPFLIIKKKQKKNGGKQKNPIKKLNYI